MNRKTLIISLLVFVAMAFLSLTTRVTLVLESNPPSNMTLLSLLLFAVYSIFVVTLFLKLGIEKFGGFNLTAIGWKNESWAKNIVFGLVGFIAVSMGICLTAIIFSIYHLAFHPMALIGRFVQGFIYGFLKESTDALIAPSVAHVLIWVLWGFF